jgi:hypothetical protein
MIDFVQSEGGLLDQDDLVNFEIEVEETVLPTLATTESSPAEPGVRDRPSPRRSKFSNQTIYRDSNTTLSSTYIL